MSDFRFGSVYIQTVEGLPMKFPTFLACFLLGALPALAADLRSDVAEALSEVGKLKAMRPGERYTVIVGGNKVTDRKDAFLRRRNAEEIERSGLSCGCGDYAILFIDLIGSRGYDTLLVDSAQVSLLSLWSEFAGHAVVAVRPPGQTEGGWWLVDSTTRKVLSENWSAEARSFVSGSSLYWIGYAGPLEKYPARTPQELRQFYRDTLATVPPAVLNRAIPRLTFTVDSSLKLGDGAYRNPNLPKLTSEQDALFAKYKITPERRYNVRLTRGGDDGSGGLKTVEGEWVATVGLKSACSPKFLSYMAEVLALHDRKNLRPRDADSAQGATSMKL